MSSPTLQHYVGGQWVDVGPEILHQPSDTTDAVGVCREAEESLVIEAVLRACGATRLGRLES